MRKYLKMLLLLAVLAPSLRAQSAPEVLRVNADRVNLRRAPSVDSAVVRGLTRGTDVTVISRDGGWVQVRLKDQTTGWVRGNLLAATAPAAATTEAKTVATQPTPAAPRSSTPSPSDAESAPSRRAPPPAETRQTPEPVRQPGYKDPGTAVLFGVLITGGGQLYAGETGRGLTLLGVGLGGVIVGCVATNSLSGCELGLVVDLAAWVYGIADASASARRMNAAHGLHAALAPMFVPGKHSRLGLEVSVTF